MTRDRTISQNPVFGKISLDTFAAAAIVGWVLVEVSLRWGIAPMLATSFGNVLALEGGSVAMISFVLSVIGLTLFTSGLAWGGRRFGITPSEWDYTVSLRSVAAGLGGVVGYFVILFGIQMIIMLIGMESASSASAATGSGGLPLWAIGAFLLANGVVVPIIEEFAWRGVIQTALMESYGVGIGSLLTAAAFVLKHVIVDWGESWIRLASLIVLALLFCGLRARLGTTSSTICHIGVNSIATAMVISLSL